MTTDALALDLIRWLHLVSMIGAFGVLLAVQTVLNRADRNNAANARRYARLLNLLIGLGFAAGLALYVQAARAAAGDAEALSSHVHGVVGVKMVLVLAVGACVGIAAAAIRKGHPSRANALRTTAAVLMALAALLGVTL